MGYQVTDCIFKVTTASEFNFIINLYLGQIVMKPVETCIYMGNQAPCE
jgi:hypothetical protein